MVEWRNGRNPSTPRAFVNLEERRTRGRRGLMGDREGPIVGIDLGTRYALVAIREGTMTRVLENRWGRTRTPAFVAVSPEGLIAGEEAARYSLIHPERSFWDVKRRVGSSWLARVDGRAYAAEDLLVPLLALLREDAEAALSSFVDACALAVPAHFSFAERAALASAARSAGFERIRIVNEPTAAALAVGLSGRVLILDFGAGTTDASVVEGEEGVCQVLDSLGRGDLGGVDLDKRLGRILQRLAGFAVSPQDPRWPLLWAEAEQVKIALSDAGRVLWSPPSGLFPEGRPVEISREEFERTADPLLEEVVRMAERLYRRHRPDHLLLVGGSSRIPLLRRKIAERLREPERLRLCPDEAVALGAALYARQGTERLLIDVLSASLGVLDAEGEVVPILERGSPLPAEAARSFSARGRGLMEVAVVQGEGRLHSSRRLLRTLRIDGVEDGEEVSVSFRVDGGGLLSVEVLKSDGAVRQVISLDGGADREVPFDYEGELRCREERFARLGAEIAPEGQRRFGELLRRARSMGRSEVRLRRAVVETLDRTLFELERCFR
jgi:molecular chaperone DnaK (HSP70)